MRLISLTMVSLAGSLAIAATEAFSQEGLPAERNVFAWSWAQMPNLAVDRELPRLVRLDDGHVLIVGGGSELRATAEASTEMLDLAAKTWRAGPPLNVRRRDAEVVGLPDGSVLAIGGSDGPTRTGLRSVEILDQRTRTWKLVAPMKEGRIGHTAVLLTDGRVMVIGGQESPEKFLKSAEIYDPKADAWATTEPMSAERSVHHARPLKDGRVIVIGGGTDVTATSSTEIFDPKSGKWSQTGSLIEPRWGFASAVLDDGRVLVAGGRVPAKKGASLPEDQMVILRGAEIFDPQAGKWTKVAEMHQPRSMGIPNVDLIKLPNGGLLFAGGRSYPAPYNGVSSAEFFDTKASTWHSVAPMKESRSYQASMLLSQGRVLVAGGRGPRFLPIKETECFEPMGR